MKMKEIFKKNEDVLNKELMELKKKIQELKFKISIREEKNVRGIRGLKKDIARINTVLRQKEIIALETKKPQINKEIEQTAQDDINKDLKKNSKN